MSCDEKYPEGVPNGHYGWGVEHGYPNLFFVIDSLQDHSNDADIEVDRLATILLLFKIEPPTLSKELSCLRLGLSGWRTIDSPSLPPLHPLSERITSNMPLTCSYLLDFVEEDPLVDFWGIMASQVWPPNLMAAARRLLAAQNRYGNHYYEDKLMDLIIAFEAIVVRKNEPHKGSPMSTRGAKLTGLRGHQLHEAAAQIALAYDLRNDIVHDGYFDPSHLARLNTVGIYPEIDHLVLAIEKHLRNAMTEYIKFSGEGLTKEQIIADLSTT